MDKLKELLGEELYNQVIAKLGDTKIMIDDGNFIPKSRFDEVNEQKKEYKKMLEERNKQLEELKAKAQGNEELLNKIKELEEKNKSTVEEYENKIKQMQFERALENELIKHKAKNIKAVKALLNLENIKLDGEKLIGLEDQIKELQESDSYLFGEDKLKGREPKTDVNNPPSVKKNPWSKDYFNLTEQGRILRENPELAKQLIAQAGIKK